MQFYECSPIIGIANSPKNCLSPKYLHNVLQGPCFHTCRVINKWEGMLGGAWGIILIHFDPDSINILMRQLWSF